MSNLPDRVNGKLPKYTSLGCYPLLYLSERGDVLCANCATEALAESDDPPTNCDANWEDPCLHCEECNTRIESAYAEDDVALEDK